MKDISYIYNIVKDKYPLLLTTTFALDDGYTIDVPVIRGETSGGRFDLYITEGLYVFSIEFFDRDSNDTYTHLHPVDVENAVEYINKFMCNRWDEF